MESLGLETAQPPASRRLGETLLHLMGQKRKKNVTLTYRGAHGQLKTHSPRE